MLANMIDYLRVSLYALLIVLIVLIFQAWDKDYAKLMPATSTTLTTNDSYIPQTIAASEQTKTVANSEVPPKNIALASEHTIHIKTDVLNIVIDAMGGNITEVSLPKYPKDLHSTAPVLLFNDRPDTTYLAQSGFLSQEGPDTPKGQALYTVEQKNYTLSQGQNPLQVKLHWQNQQGLIVNKIFTFYPGSYEIHVEYQIDNKMHKPWQGNLYLQLLRANTPPPNAHGFMNLSTYFGAAISTPNKPFEKISFKDMDKKNISQTVTGGWAAMIQHYFVSAWVPEKNTASQYYSHVTSSGLYTIGMMAEKKVVNPGETVKTGATLYVGPSIANQLEKVNPDLKLTIDYGWLWPISVVIFWMMQKIYNIIGNWGWSIVCVTILIKILFYQLSAKSYRSMSAMKKLQPRINALKERFGEDKQKFTQAVMELYKKEKANPMSGCLPILIQIPVFIALYWVLIESVQLRQAPFILWIQDLALKDPYYVLPVLMGLSMFLQQRLNPPPPDPMQAKVLMLMPILFTAMFYNFPAGLMLYWFVNNTLSFLQQWYIMHSMEKSESKKGK